MIADIVSATGSHFYCKNWTLTFHFPSANGTQWQFEKGCLDPTNPSQLVTAIGNSKDSTARINSCVDATAPAVDYALKNSEE